MSLRSPRACSLKEKHCLAGSEGIAGEGRSGDRKYLEARVRRFLKSYLAAEGTTKHRYYEASGSICCCHPELPIQPKDVHIAEATAEAALKVVKRRGQRANDSHEAWRY